jgi:DNA-binding HxlR family transcriptional regulator
MTTSRTYGDRCGVARALDVVGERWALLVVRELLLGAKRFTDLRSGLPRVSADVLAQRLRELEDAGIVQRRTLPPPAASKVYELTPRGAELEPVVVALGRWGANTPPPAADVGMSVDSLMVSLKTLFEPSLAGGLDARFELQLDEHRFRAEVADGRLVLKRGEAATPSATITTDAGTLLALIRGRRELAAARRAGDIAISGDQEAASRLLTLFPLPDRTAA